MVKLRGSWVGIPFTYNFRAPIHNIRIPQTMAMKGQFLRGYWVFNLIHMHMTGKTLDLQWDVKVAVVQKDVQCASSAILVAAEPG